MKSSIKAKREKAKAENGRISPFGQTSLYKGVSSRSEHLPRTE